jgi:hypothetical protein
LTTHATLYYRISPKLTKGNFLKLTQLLAINAILFIGLGIAFALYGPLMIAMFGILEGEGSPMMYWYAASFARLLGAALFGFGFLLWAVRRQPGSAPAQQGVKIALVIAYALSFVVAITQQVSVWGTIAGWITSGLFLALLVTYVYVLVVRTAE